VIPVSIVPAKSKLKKCPECGADPIVKTWPPPEEAGCSMLYGVVCPECGYDTFGSPCQQEAEHFWEIDW